jgi:hypothetical protein
MERKQKSRELRRWHSLILSTDGPSNAEARLVALAIAHHVDWGTFATVVGAETIATITQICERTVRNRIQQLICEGFLAARQIGRGRTWKLRELTLRWPASRAGHEDARLAQDAGHDASRPVNGAAKTGTAASHDRQGVHPISSETTKEISSKSAAPPSPAEAGSAAPEQQLWTDDQLRHHVKSMRRLFWSDERILKKYARFGMTDSHLGDGQPGQPDMTDSDRAAQEP